MSAFVALIAGGTKGIGLATALEFARHGAHCVITHKWDSTDKDELRRQFDATGGMQPLIVQADVKNDEDTDALLDQIKAYHNKVDAFVSAAAFAQIVDKVENYSRRDFLNSIEYTTWPLVEYPRRIRKVFGKYPRYVIGISSSGPNQYCSNYDMVAGCKAALEAIGRYMAYRLIQEPVNVNVVRARYVRTESLRATAGDGFEPYVDARAPDLFIDKGDVGSAVFGLCTGLMDAVNGQIIMVDQGTEFYDGVSMLFDRNAHRSSARR